MAANRNLPSWWVRIEEMRAQPDYLRYHPDTPWLPPRCLGRNRRHATTYMPDGHALLFDGTASQTNGPQFQPVPQRLPAHLLRGQPFQTYSVYVGHYGEIFNVPYNATAYPVDDGVDVEDDAEVTTRRLPDWQRLGFDEVRGQRGVSDAKYHGDSEVLIAWHRRSNWAKQLVPRVHRGTNVLDDSEAGGSLVGHIALLIALLALTLPINLVVRSLPLLVRREWRCADERVIEAARHREPGSKRGLVVTVWINMPDLDLTRADHRNQHEAFQEAMRRYQKGYYGHHFGRNA